jgi:hypothetical protein
VEILPGTGSDDVEDASFTIETTVLSPNAAVGAITMVEPLVAVSTDGSIDEKAVREALGTGGKDLLIIAPRVSPSVLRSFLRRSARLVVVRPTDPQLDLAQLKDRLLDRNGRTCGTAQRALVLTESTTIDRPSLSLGIGHSRQIVRVNPATDERMAVAGRALAAARAATHGPVIPDGPALLKQVAGTDSTDDAPDELTEAVRDVVRRAAAAPCERIDATGATTAQRGDCVTTVAAAISHAAASARRFLC